MSWCSSNFDCGLNSQCVDGVCVYNDVAAVVVEDVASSGCMAVPNHQEMVSIPQYNYTQHSQPVVKQWTTLDVQYNQIPVSQTLSQQTYPTLTTCANTSYKAPGCNRF